MLCCAALLLVLGLVREGWFLLPGTGRPTEVGFAPVARRPAPGEFAAVPELVRPPGPAQVCPGRLATLLLLFGLGTVLYAIAVYLFLLLGFAEQGAGVGLGTWVIRDVALGTVAVGAAVSAARLAPVPRTPSGREVQGIALAGAGAAWWFLGLTDMHVFGVIEVGGGHLGWDLLFHGFGAVLILAGAALWAGKPTRTLPPQRTGELERSLHD